MLPTHGTLVGYALLLWSELPARSPCNHSEICPLPRSLILFNSKREAFALCLQRVLPAAGLPLPPWHSSVSAVREVGTVVLPVGRRCFLSLEFSDEMCFKLCIEDLSSMLGHSRKYKPFNSLKLWVHVALSTLSWQPCVSEQSDCFEQGLTGLFGK